MPLIFFPFVLSSLSDALVALGRISSFLTAEELPEPHKIVQGRECAVEVDGDFTWETVPSALVRATNAGFAGGRGRGRGRVVGSGGRGGRNGRSKRKGGNGDAGGNADRKRRGWWMFRSKKETVLEGLPVSKKDIDASEGNGDQDEDEKAEEESSEKEKGKEDEKPFELKGLRMVVPRGAFVGVVGRVGSGKVRILCPCFWFSETDTYDHMI